MVRIRLHNSILTGDSIYSIIGRCALATATPYLVALLLLSAGSAVLLRSLSWPLASLFITTAAICLWGLLERIFPEPRRIVVDVAEWILVVMGTIAAVLASFGILFWILGPSPKL
jgi:hypothetical protein